MRCGFSGGGKCKEKESGHCAEHDAQTESEERARKAEPGSEHGHELGVAEADAFAAADEPIDAADEKDYAGGEDDGERGADRSGQDADTPWLVGVNLQARIEIGLDKSEDNADSDSWQREPVGKPKLFGIEGSERDQQPIKEKLAE